MRACEVWSLILHQRKMIGRECIPKCIPKVVKAFFTAYNAMGGSLTSGERRAARHRRWATNALDSAARLQGTADGETLLQIARRYFLLAQKAETTRQRKDKEPGTDRSV